MGEDLLDHHGSFDASDDLDVARAAIAALDVDVKNALQALRPGHGGRAFRGRSVLGPIRRTSLVALAAFGRRHLRTMRTIGGKHAMESRQVDPWLGHQGDESLNKAHRLEDDVRGAIAVRCLELVTHRAIAQYRPQRACGSGH